MKSNSRRSRPKTILFSWLLYVFAAVMVVLGYLGTQPPAPALTLVAQVLTLVYFAFFALMPWWSRMGTFKPVPARITFSAH